MLGEKWLACGVSRFLLMRYNGNVLLWRGGQLPVDRVLDRRGDGGSGSGNSHKLAKRLWISTRCQYFGEG